MGMNCPPPGDVVPISWMQIFTRVVFGFLACTAISACGYAVLEGQKIEAESELDQINRWKEEVIAEGKAARIGGVPASANPYAVQPTFWSNSTRQSALWLKGWAEGKEEP